ncbi:MAG: ABC transporter substrate-binding protein, partial [Xanthobacteraceae bacterium]
MKTIVGSTLTLWAFSLFHALPVAAQSQSPVKVGVALNFAADGGAAGFYHALERGYFRDLGLDVAIEPSKGSADAITRTASQASDIGVGDISTLVEFASRRPEIAPRAVFHSSQSFAASRDLAQEQRDHRAHRPARPHPRPGPSGCALAHVPGGREHRR